MLRMGVAAAAALMTTGAYALELTSPDIAPGAKIADEYVFSGFGCTGKNVSPALKWSGAPAGTKSFALMVYDPDAPTGSGFWHWVMFDIPPSVMELPQGAGDLKAGKAPAGAVQSRTDYGAPAMAAPARRRAIRRTTIISCCSPSMRPSSGRTPTRPRPWSASTCTTTRWRKRS